MKIVYCIAGTYNSGGMERVLANKANYLVKAGHEITIVTTDQKGRNPYFEFDARIRHVDLGINYKDVNGLVNKIITYSFNQRKHKKKLKEILIELKADIVISMFDHESNFVHDLTDGSKKVIEIHFSRYKRLQYGRRGLWRLFDKWRSIEDLKIVKKYDAFVVLTNEDKGYWGNLSNIHVIPNSNSFENDKSSTLSSKNVIAVGRLSDQKDFASMIDIWALVSLDYPDWTLHIYGEGELENDLRIKIEQNNLTKQVILHKPIINIKDIYLESSLFIMTSKYEGLPMAMLEAQVCGLPIISYDCKCGPKDVIYEGKNGYIIRSADKEGFANKIKELIIDLEKRRRMGAYSKAYAYNFSEEIIMRKWENLFNQIVNE